MSKKTKVTIGIIAAFVVAIICGIVTWLTSIETRLDIFKSRLDFIDDITEGMPYWKDQTTHAVNDLYGKVTKLTLNKADRVELEKQKKN